MTEKKKTESQKVTNEKKPINAPAIKGSYYEAEIPDTLDLAELAQLGLNHFLGIIREEYNYEMPLTFGFAPPVMDMHGNSLGACQCKAMEAMAFLRLMTGSTKGLDREAKMLEMMTSMFGEDGLHWVLAGYAVAKHSRAFCDGARSRTHSAGYGCLVPVHRRFQMERSNQRACGRD